MISLLTMDGACGQKSMAERPSFSLPLPVVSASELNNDKEIQVANLFDLLRQ